jgi:hypothetical protein
MPIKSVDVSKPVKAFTKSKTIDFISYASDSKSGIVPKPIASSKCGIVSKPITPKLLVAATCKSYQESDGNVIFKPKDLNAMINDSNVINNVDNTY